MTGNSKVAVYAALAPNLAIAATKCGAFLFTSSTAMLTEAIHSTVDTGNEALLLFGFDRAARPPDETHPFGHGMEIYFFVHRCPADFHCRRRGGKSTKAL